MGYYTQYDGSYTITPEIPESAWPADMREEGDSYFVLTQEGGTQTVDLVAGQVAVVGKPGRTIATFRFEESVKGYDFEDAVKELIAWAQSYGSKVDGCVTADGEESTDFSRFRVENNVLHHEVPVLLWPNGDTDTL